MTKASATGKLRIAYLCGEYPRATDTFIQREVAQIRVAGVDVETMSIRRPLARESGSQEQEAERRRTFYVLPSSPFRLLAAHVARILRNPLTYCRAFWIALTVRGPGLRALIYQLFYFAEAGIVATELQRRRVSHIHNHAPDSSGYVTLLASVLGGFTYSITLHGFGILSEPVRHRLTEKLEASLFVICISHHARSQAMLRSSSECWSRFHVVHCGVNPLDYSVRRHTGRGRRVLFVGRLDTVKGLPVLVEAFSTLIRTGEECHLDIVGDGPERTELEALICSLDLNTCVTFHGYQSQAEIRRMLTECDLFAMTSFFEGIPVVLMEAMAAGLPVVAPRITGIPELVEDGVSGFLTTPAKSDELADRISMLLQNAELRNQFGAAGRAMVEREFCLQMETTRLAEIFVRRLQGESVPVRPKISKPDLARMDS